MAAAVQIISQEGDQQKVLVTKIAPIQAPFNHDLLTFSVPLKGYSHLITGEQQRVRLITLNELQITQLPTK